MMNAIKSRNVWVSGNTAVISGDNGVLSVLLHGHTIAHVLTCGKITVNKSVLAAWPTRTTISRLRAMGVDVCTKKHVVHLNGKPL